MAINKNRIKNKLDANRAKNSIRQKVETALSPSIKSAMAAKLDKDVSSVTEADMENELNAAVDSVMDTMGYVVDALFDEIDILIGGIVDELKNNAEISYTVVVPAQNLGEAMVLPGTFSQGAGAAAVPNVAPVSVKISKIKVPKGGLK